MYCSFQKWLHSAAQCFIFGGRRVFEFPVSKTDSLIPSSKLAVRKQPARYRAKLYLWTTVRRLLRTKIAWPENWGIINADCKFASTEKSLSTFRQKLSGWAELSRLSRPRHTGPSCDNRVSLSATVFRSRWTPSDYLQ